MKNLFRWMLVLTAAVMFSGCEDIFSSDTDEDNDVVFDNKSTYTVYVTPSAQSNWTGFSIPPGGKVKLNDPKDVYFTYEPRFRVTIGEQSDGRVLFINLKEGTVAVE